jgi:hypothetical protein
MAESARLIIPVWGEAYVDEVLSITLPAALAPGNLPALCGIFDVELAIVTESRLFDMVRNARSFQAAERVCKTRLVPLDDLLTSVFTDYGMVLTYALFRGFADLGPRLTETYLLPFVADFVISDGALRHLGILMQQGKRVIHAPSFRVVAEEVDPRLRALVDPTSCVLSVPPRALAKLALANKHPTVKARTINQRLCHLEWMDQFYWYVDDDTLIGYQSPSALVAVKPEHFVSQPANFWDYGFLPEAAPTAEPYLIGDSDDFFMIEPQSRTTGQEMTRIGWTSFDGLARTESLRATAEHRRLGRQLIKIHAADLPDSIGGVIEESRAFMAELYPRLSSKPAPHIGHPLLGRWFEEASLRQRGAQDEVLSTPAGQASAGAASAGGATRRVGFFAFAVRALQRLYCMMFGAPPKVSKCHPLWTEVSPINRKIATSQRSGRANFLWIDSGNWRLLANQAAGDRKAADSRSPFLKTAPYDVCVCELALKEMSELNRLYATLRPLMEDGGYVVFKTAKVGGAFDGAELFLSCCEFPDLDVSRINFHGSAIIALLRALHVRAMRPVATRPLARGAILCTLILLAPLVWLANAWTARRDPSIFRATWTSLTVEFTVKRRSAATPLLDPSRAEAEDAIP